MPLRPARIISFEQLCVEADPDWVIESYQPEQYEFSNGRVFDHNIPFYAPNPETSDERLATDFFVVVNA